MRNNACRLGALTHLLKRDLGDTWDLLYGMIDGRVIGSRLSKSAAAPAGALQISTVQLFYYMNSKVVDIVMGHCLP